MLKIRTGTFETNSSSTHAFCLCLKADYNAWREGKMLFDKNRKTGKYLVTTEDASNYCKQHYEYYEEELAEDLADGEGELYTLREYGFYTFEDYCSQEESNAEEQEFAELTTPNGDTVVSFWYYGYDG